MELCPQSKRKEPKDEMKGDTVDATKDELKETVKIKGIRFCDSMKEESLRKVKYKKEGVPSTQQPWLKQEREEPVDMLKSESGEDNEEPLLRSRCRNDCQHELQVICLGETCDKMFVEWKPCKKHILVCCGIASNQQNSKELANRSSMKAKKQGAQYRKVGKKKGLLPQPSEQDLVQTVEQYYDSLLHNPVDRKHVLGHIRKLYGKGEFRRFGFGTFIEFSKRHGIEVYFHEKDQIIKSRKEITSKILQTLKGFKKTYLGKINISCNPCGRDLNTDYIQGEKRREVKEHIQRVHPHTYSEMAQKTGLSQGEQALDSIILVSLEWGNFNKAQVEAKESPISFSMKKVNDLAKEDILSRLCEVFYRTENNYHCVLCDNKLIGRDTQEARDHLANRHTKEDLEMKQFIKEKYDQYVNANFETFLRLVLLKVEKF